MLSKLIYSFVLMSLIYIVPESAQAQVGWGIFNGSYTTQTFYRSAEGSFEYKKGKLYIKMKGLPVDADKNLPKQLQTRDHGTFNVAAYELVAYQKVITWEPMKDKNGNSLEGRLQQVFRYGKIKSLGFFTPGQTENTKFSVTKKGRAKFRAKGVDLVGYDGLFLLAHIEGRDSVALQEGDIISYNIRDDRSAFRIMKGPIFWK